MRSIAAVLVLLSVACDGAPAPAPAPAATPRAPVRRLDATLTGFLPANRAALDALLEARGSHSAGYDAAFRPVATFDWDNTMMRNDIGDATMAWLLRHDGILQPPARNWSVTSAALTPAAIAALGAACDAAAEPGQPLTTSTTPACADAIETIYSDGHTPDGTAAWTHEVTLTTNEAYAWLARLLAGHTPAEVSGFARQAYAENSAAAIGAVQTVGTRPDITAWVRIYDQMRDLVGALQADGFDVWIVSASPQDVTSVVAHEVGIEADHVVGVRTVHSADGRLGYDLESCGDAPTNSLITFDQGKRCWINRAIFHLPVARQRPRADTAHRPTFSAGDSDTDVSFVQDATDLKLVIDRNRVQIMCNAYSNREDRWRVQPMFIQPLPPRAAPYPCSTAVDASGAPIVDEAGRHMTDQTESRAR